MNFPTGRKKIFHMIQLSIADLAGLIELGGDVHIEI